MTDEEIREKEKLNQKIKDNLNKLDDENRKIVIKEIEKIALESKNPEYCYYVACELEGTDKKALEKVVLESKNPKYSYFFSTGIAGADIKAHEQVVLNSDDLDLWTDFAFYVEGADVYKIINTLHETSEGDEYANEIVEDLLLPDYRKNNIISLTKRLMNNKD